MSPINEENTAQASSDIQKAIEVISKALLTPLSKHRTDNPVSIKFDNDIKIITEDGYIETGANDVTRIIAETAGIKPDESSGHIKAAVEVLSKALLANVEKRMDSPITIEYGNGVQMFKWDSLIASGNSNVGQTIAEITKVKSDTPTQQATQPEVKTQKPAIKPLKM